jgi:hypothetical protein
VHMGREGEAAIVRRQEFQPREALGAMLARELPHRVSVGHPASIPFCSSPDKLGSIPAFRSDRRLSGERCLAPE